MAPATAGSSAGGAGALIPSDGGDAHGGAMNAQGGAAQGGERSGGGAANGGAANEGGAGGDSALTADFDGSGCVDLHDYAVIVRGFDCSLANCGDPRADLNHDGWIDFSDYLIYVQQWYQGPNCRAVCEATDGQGGAGGRSADVDGSGCVDADDLDVLAASYGCLTTECGSPNADIVEDGCVNGADVDLWRDQFMQGPSCP